MLGEKVLKSGFGNSPSKGSFGKKISRGSFGKKPSKGDFGKKASRGSFGTTQGSSLKSTTPLKRKSAKNTVTKEEQEFMDWLHSDAQYFDYPCFVCGKFNPNDTIKWHHVKEFSSDKKNHKRQIPLCDNEHHRLGTELSPHGTPKKWRATYSMKVQNEYADSIWNDFITSKNSLL